MSTCAFLMWLNEKYVITLETGINEMEYSVRALLSVLLLNVLCRVKGELGDRSGEGD